MIDWTQMRHPDDLASEAFTERLAAAKAECRRRTWRWPARPRC